MRDVPNQPPRPLRIGIVNQSVAGWAASVSYTRMLVHSLCGAASASDTQLFLLSPAGSAHGLPNNAALKTIELKDSPGFLPAERAVRRLLGVPGKSSPLKGEQSLRHAVRLRDESNLFRVAEEQRLSVLLPVFDVPNWKLKVATIGWIPDFQHLYLPQYFSEAEKQKRLDSMRRLAKRARIMMLSSMTSAQHFSDVMPEFTGKVRVLPFPSLLAFEQIPETGAGSRERFNVPAKFALVANQFWAHKNHLVVVEAVKQLMQRGMDIHVVMTGLPLDNRDPANQTMSDIFQAIARAGAGSRITILGQVSYPELMDLMRTAAVVLQPSRFEGWSTVVQDAKALGRPLICSDIAVHREQAPGALAFFPVDDAGALADALADVWASLEPGPDPETEAQCIAKEKDFAREHGRNLLDLCREAFLI